MSGPTFAHSAQPQRVSIDWFAAAHDARAQLLRLSTPRPRRFARAQHLSQTEKHLATVNTKPGVHALAQLSALMAPTIPGIATAPVPVLVPLQARGPRGERGRPLRVGSLDNIQFVAGQSGYDAIITVPPKLLRNLGIKTTLQPQLHLAGSALRYGRARDGKRLTGFPDRFTSVSKAVGTDEITYSFQQYGVPYFINTGCRSGPSQDHILTCNDADVIIRAVLPDLQLVGGGAVGGEQLAAVPRHAITPRHPTTRSTDFTYHPPGRLLPGSSEAGRGGSTRRVEYGQALRFPIRRAPVYANSQVFMHWGRCLGERIELPSTPGAHKRYKCRQTGHVLEQFEGHAENYSYPWRDTYCEVRGHGEPADCPLKRGHAGQDLRPSKCRADTDNIDRCQDDVFDVVAVTDGWAWWKTGVHENHLRLNADDGTNKLYYMYLHMSPKSLSAAGMQRGKLVRVRKGQLIGKVGNHWKTNPGGTTTHLHFEIRRGDDIGKPLSPYWTLVRAYERLLGKKGTEIAESRDADLKAGSD